MVQSCLLLTGFLSELIGVEQIPEVEAEMERKDEEVPGVTLLLNPPPPVRGGLALLVSFFLGVDCKGVLVTILRLGVDDAEEELFPDSSEDTEGLAPASLSQSEISVIVKYYESQFQSKIST